MLIYFLPFPLILTDSFLKSERNQIESMRIKRKNENNFALLVIGSIYN